MIRPATEADVPAIIELGAEMHRESPRLASFSYSPGKVYELLDVLIGCGGFAWVSVADGRINGLMLGFVQEHWFSEDLAAQELALYIEPASRGSSSAARLIAQFKGWAAERGVMPGNIMAGISTGIHVEQTARLYEAFGFRRFGLLLGA